MDLLHLPSPLQQLFSPLFFRDAIWIKRDDLIHPLISGNKSRKLQHYLADAKAQSKTQLVSFGGAFSNHLLALASAAAENGLRSTGFVRGETIENEMLFMCRLLGMKLIFADRAAYRDKTALFMRHFAEDETAYRIDEGGCGPLGARGCEAVIDELPADFTHVFCACGTGTTAAGLINRAAERYSEMRIHVVPVLRHAGMRADIDRLLKRPADYALHDQYHFGGYAKTDPRLLAFISELAATTGILSDPVYTGKLFFALHDLLEKNQIGPGKIAVLHSGGLFGLLGMRTRFPDAF